LPLTGGTLTGALNTNATLNANSFAFFNGAFQWNLNAGNTPIYPQISGPATMHRAIQGATNGSARWNLILGNGGTETGAGNVGSDFYIQRYSDGGVLIDNPMSIIRSNGAINLTTGIMGSITGANVAAGIVGEVIASLNTAGVAGATQVTSNIASIVLTAGDWDVFGEVLLTISGGGALSGYHAAINTVSATIPTVPAMNTARTSINGVSVSPAVSVPLAPCRALITVNTTYYLMMLPVFVTGSLLGQGKIWARRR
jgi:hypothetical protein